MKFGGTSVADREAIVRLAAIVADVVRRGETPLVVVSALAGTTDALLALAAEAAGGDGGAARARIETLRVRHHEAADAVADPAARETLLEAVDRELDEVARVAEALAVLREATPRWRDVLAAAGELLSSRVVAAVLADRGLSAAWVDARTVLRTDGEHEAARPLLAETEAAVRSTFAPLLAAGRIPVLGGFVGATAAGVTTTLGRGGSDYSAALVGAGLDAAEIQIWTDVDGMLTADPRVVGDARPVPRLSFAEAAELAYFGAKVLHPATIQPAVARDIPVRIRNSRRPEAPGTLITRERPPDGRPLTAVAAKQGITVVDITSTRMLMAHGFLKRIFEIFDQHKTPVDVVTTSEVSVSVTVDDTRRLPQIVAALRDVAEVTREDDMAILCAVGDGLRQAPTFVGELLAAIDGIPIRMLSQAAARRNITLVLRAADLERALARVQSMFLLAEVS